MRTLVSWSPARELASFSDDFDSLFRTVFRAAQPHAARPAVLAPRIETFVKDGQFVVRADLPGVEPAKVAVTVEGDRLRISGEREEWRQNGEGHLHYREISYGRFAREIELPEWTDPDSVTASYRDGVLEVTTKTLSEPVKKIPVSVH